MSGQKTGGLFGLFLRYDGVLPLPFEFIPQSEIEEL